MEQSLVTLVYGMQPDSVGFHVRGSNRMVMSGSQRNRRRIRVPRNTATATKSTLTVGSDPFRERLLTRRLFIIFYNHQYPTFSCLRHVLILILFSYQDHISVSSVQLCFP